MQPDQLLSDREKMDYMKSQITDSQITGTGHEIDLQRYTQNVFGDFSGQNITSDDREEDADLYVVDVAVEYKADFGLQRRPFSPPFKV